MASSSDLASIVLGILARHGGRMMSDELIDACRAEVEHAAPHPGDVIRQLESEVNRLIKDGQLGHHTKPSRMPGAPNTIGELWLTVPR